MAASEKNTPSIDLVEIVEKMGGAGRIRQDFRNFSHRIERLDARRDELKKRYPDKWVALLDDGGVIASDRLSDVLEELDGRGISRRKAIVKLMETKPSVTII